MNRTRVCDLLGISYPIIQGGMLWIATAELAAAVSNAGALGVISPLAGMQIFALVPQVVDAVSVPVVAAGGIVDGRGAAAALALGAEGIQLGTRFVAVSENIAHINYTQAIIAAHDNDTIITCRRILPTRSLKTVFTKTLMELEESGASVEDISNFIGYRSNRTAQIEGYLNGGEAYCGASAGLFKEILSVKEVIRQLVDGYASVLKRLN